MGGFSATAAGLSHPSGKGEPHRAESEQRLAFLPTPQRQLLGGVFSPSALMQSIIINKLVLLICYRSAKEIPVRVPEPAAEVTVWWMRGNSQAWQGWRVEIPTFLVGLHTPGA